MRLSLTAAVLSSALLLAGCLLPDKYDAEITLAPDGTFDASLKGEGTMVMGYLDYQKPNANKAALDKSMAEFEAEVNKDKGYAIKHKGNARFDVKYQDHGKVPQNVAAEIFFSFIKIAKTEDGYIVRSATAPKGDREKLSKAGITSVGTVCIKTDMTVVEHNADSTPWLFSKCYKWKDLDALSERSIKLRLKQ
jgi:hypothetical protein